MLEQEFIDAPAPSPLQSSLLNTFEGDLEANVIQIDKNTNQKMIIVTQDKTILCLKRNLAKLGRRQWLAPLSTVLTILISLTTANFQGALGLGPSEWRAIFVVAGFITTGWLIFTVRQALNAKTFQEVITDIVYELGARKKPTLDRLT